MSTIDRRAFVQAAIAFGAVATWSVAESVPTSSGWRERTGLFPEGVASGDPDFQSVLLWTRRPYPEGSPQRLLQVEVAEDQSFARVIGKAKAPISSASDWTCRVFVGGLKCSTTYWYRFTDPEGNGSRVGRTRTAPDTRDERPIRFAFVCCQNANQGAQNAYRRMIFEDEKAAGADKLDFVLHLGDFIYEMVWYPEDRPQGMYDRRLRDIVRFGYGEKIDDFHIPGDVDDYRALYRAYLHDPDIQEARARWPFVSMWDNHEFSVDGWQSFQKFGAVTRPSQTRKVAANQAFFEYQAARMSRPASASLACFNGPHVTDTPVTHFDNQGLGEERNNLIAIDSLRGYRALRWGRNIELIITDQRSYRSEDPLDRTEADVFSEKAFPEFIPEEVIKILGAGRAYNDGNPPDTISFGNAHVPNFRKSSAPQTILGAEQKKWLLRRLGRSKATWKIWCNTTATFEMRADLQHLPPGYTEPWPGAAFAGCATGDHGTALTERGEVYDYVRSQGISGFATIAGDRHSFWAGQAAKSLPPGQFSPIGIAFVVGSLSAPGLMEALEHTLPKGHALRALYLGQSASDANPQPTLNLLLRHGVRACLEYAKSGDLQKALALSNQDLSPNLSFVDMGGHGYAIVKASKTAFETEFVCIPRPLERSDTADGGPIRYRARFTTPLWKAGNIPQMTSAIVEGSAPFSIG